MARDVFHVIGGRSRVLAAIAAVALQMLTTSSAQAMDREQALAQLSVTRIPVNAEKLVQYAALGDVATVALLIDAGVTVDEREPTRNVTALHNAAAQGHLRLVSRLLDLGADVNAEDWHGVTPLVAAAASGHIKVVELLLGKGSNVNAVPHEASTALICAIRHGDLTLVDKLLHAHAQADLPDAFGMTPLEAARLAGRADIAKRIEAVLTTKD